MMLSYVPPRLRNSRILQELYQVQGAEHDAIIDAHMQIRANAFPQTATWALETWEYMQGIPVSPSKPTQERREKILSRLKGYGTCNIKLVKSVAESFDRGRVSVAVDYASGTIVVRFIDSRGLPANLTDVQNAIEDIIPAHMQIDYQYNYLTVDDLEAQGITVDQLEAKGITVANWEVSG
jgi:hypothetical protein